MWLLRSDSGRIARLLKQSLGSPALFALALAVALAMPDEASAGRLDAAQKQTNEFFQGDISFVAKIDLETSGRYFVDPEGFPVEGKRQGRRKRQSLGIGQRDLIFAAGAGGGGIRIRANEKDRRVLVGFTKKKRGMTMHIVTLYITYPREIVESDLDPLAIARALEPYIQFEGLDAGDDLAATIEALDAESSGSAADSRPLVSRSAVSGLDVRAVPEVVRPGETVVLELFFEVASSEGGASTTVSEERTVTFSGSALPGYPVDNEEARTPGTHTSRYRQPIPPGAALGTYEFKGEVCAGDDCASRVAKFEVRK